MTLSCVLHVTADYPDLFQPGNTPVIARLVESLSAEANQVVISIGRVNSPRDEEVRREDRLWMVRYFAPPFGIFQSYFLDRLARKIASLLETANVRPQIMIGHKFTIESYVCWRLWQRLGVPYVACFMGNTDCTIFRAKPHYRRKFRSVVQNAKALVFPTPWCCQFFADRLLRSAGIPEDRWHLVPYISYRNLLPIESLPASSQHFLTVCRIDLWRLKNLHRLIRAIAVLQESGGDWELDIVGSGSLESERELRKLIQKHGLQEHVRLLGGKTREQIDAILPNYCAMVMPSFPESFGLVYLEALRKGVPIMCARGAGVDGYFSEGFPGVVVAHNRLQEIIDGLVTLSERSSAYRESIHTMTNHLSLFSQDSITSQYRSLLGLDVSRQKLQSAEQDPNNRRGG
jgi:glycosyltransferase involved in cell wall biosynthesis